jgi:cytochrome c553
LNSGAERDGNFNGIPDATARIIGHRRIERQSAYFAGQSAKLLGYNLRPERSQIQRKIALMKRLSAIAFGLAVLTPALAQAADANPTPGKDKVSMCIGCHGIPGYKTAFPVTYNVPKLGGQHAAYIVKALQGYKNGDRSHPSMRAIAAGLSEQDMADVAAYYSAPAVQAAAK